MLKMKICIVFLSICLLCCNAFLFDSCSSDSDCKDGCCRSSGFSHSCVHRFLALHHTCHLNNHEYSNCGCGSGLHCIDHIEGSAIAIEGDLRPGYGYCEQGNGTSSSGNGMIATEG